MLLLFCRYDLVIKVKSKVPTEVYTEENAPHLMMLLVNVFCKSWNPSASVWQASGCWVGLSECSYF